MGTLQRPVRQDVITYTLVSLIIPSLFLSKDHDHFNSYIIHLLISNHPAFPCPFSSIIFSLHFISQYLSQVHIPNPNLSHWGQSGLGLSRFSDAFIARILLCLYSLSSTHLFLIYLSKFLILMWLCTYIAS